jgi:hypothetical protein
VKPIDFIPDYSNEQTRETLKTIGRFNYGNPANEDKDVVTLGPY